MVSSKCSCSLSPLLLCLCRLKGKKSVQFRSNSRDKLNSGLSKHDSGFVDAAWPVMPHVCLFSSCTLSFLCLLKQLLAVSYFLAAYMVLLSQHSLKWDLCLCLPVSVCITVPPQQKYQHSSKQQQQEDETDYSRCCPSGLCLTRCCQTGKRHPMRGGIKTSSDMAALKGQKMSLLQQVCTVTRTDCNRKR